MKIVAVSKYLGYEIGGAEISTREVLKAEFLKGNRIEVGFSENTQFLGKKLREAVFPNEWGIIKHRQTVNLNRFQYSEYLINRKGLIEWAANIEADELWVNGIWSPALALGFTGRIKYYIRSESDMGIYNNYRSGFKKIIRFFYGLLERPALNIHKSDLRLALVKSEIIANSNYVSKRIKDQFKLESIVQYPMIDCDRIRTNMLTRKVSEKCVVFVGDSPIKGLPIVLDLSNKMPNVNFLIFSRFVRKTRKLKNVTWMGWEKETGVVLSYAAVVIVPSQCSEAFGRIAREAYLMGIPTLVSNVGGLPEAVDYKISCIIDDYTNCDIWQSKIKSIVEN